MIYVTIPVRYLETHRKLAHRYTNWSLLQADYYVVTQLSVWAQKNLEKDTWYLSGVKPNEYTFCFEHEEDALAFKLSHGISNE